MQRLFPLLTLLVLSFTVALRDATGAEKVAEPPKAPALGKSFNEKAPKTGLSAVSDAQILFVTGRGSLCLSFDKSKETHAGIEWANNGYCSPVKYLGYQTGFHYWQFTEWQLILAINETGSGGVFDSWVFINGGNDPHYYAPGRAFSVQ
jgi:hypothetical protein